jgi:hypothetical protein
VHGSKEPRLRETTLAQDVQSSFLCCRCFISFSYNATQLWIKPCNLSTNFKFSLWLRTVTFTLLLEHCPSLRGYAAWTWLRVMGEWEIRHPQTYRHTEIQQRSWGREGCMFLMGNVSAYLSQSVYFIRSVQGKDSGLKFLFLKFLSFFFFTYLLFYCVWPKSCIKIGK